MLFVSRRSFEVPAEALQCLGAPCFALFESVELGAKHRQSVILGQPMIVMLGVVLIIRQAFAVFDGALKQQLLRSLVHQPCIHAGLQQVAERFGSRRNLSVAPGKFAQSALAQWVLPEPVFGQLERARERFFVMLLLIRCQKRPDPSPGMQAGAPASVVVRVLVPVHRQTEVGGCLLGWEFGKIYLGCLQWPDV